VKTTATLQYYAFVLLCKTTFCLCEFHETRF